MKSIVVASLLGLVLLVAAAKADCDDVPKNPDDGEVTHFFKNLGCKISEGASKLSESAKPIAEKIGNSAKDFGSSVAEKYDEIKHKLTEDSSAGANKASTPIYDGPTEKVPLAPLGGDSPSINAQQAAATAALKPDA